MAKHSTNHPTIIHYNKNGHYLCTSTKTTPAKLTSDRRYVTCVNCLRKLYPPSKSRLTAEPRYECTAPIFAPHCDEPYNYRDGCLSTKPCSFKQVVKP